MLKEEVYRLTKKIPKGKVTTYSNIGYALNSRAFQAIGQILVRNIEGFKDARKNIPCHRVVLKDGTLGGFYGKKCGEETCIKKALLEKEGIRFDKDNKIINFKKVLHEF